MLKYKQFFEGKTTKLQYSDFFYLKKIAEAKSGKAMLYGFELKNKKFQLWIPSGAIYNEIDHVLPDLSDSYKMVYLANFISKPDTFDKTHETREDFFKQYNKYMVPVIERLEFKKKNLELLSLYKDFKKEIKKIIPEIIIEDFNIEDKSFETNYGRFEIYSVKPLTFKLGDLFLNMNDENGIILNYKNRFKITLLGRDGILGKALIKNNSNQKLNAVEIMSIKKIYENVLKSYDWYSYMSDDRRVWKKGEDQDKRLSCIRSVLEDIGLENYSNEMYDKYSKD